MSGLSVLLIRTQVFWGRRTSVFMVYWLACPTTDPKDGGSRIKKSGFIFKVEKISKTGRDHIFKTIRWNILPLIVKIQLKLSLVMQLQLFYLIRKEGCYGWLKFVCDPRNILPILRCTIQRPPVCRHIISKAGKAALEKLKIHWLRKNSRICGHDKS